MYDGVDEIFKRCYRAPRKPNPLVTTPEQAMKLLEEVYGRMMKNRVREPTKPNWRNTPEIRTLSDKNDSLEKLLEKAVGFLAEHGHMPGWANQVPTASGISGSSAWKHANVDLVHWNEDDSRLRLIELKWARHTPSTPGFEAAIFEIIRYTLSYIYFRSIKWDKPIMRARTVSLEIIGPPCFFGGHYAVHKSAIDSFGSALASFAERELAGAPAMSLKLHRFAHDFQIPFANGHEVKAECGREWNPNGKAATVRDAFNNLTEVQ